MRDKPKEGRETSWWEPVSEINLMKEEKQAGGSQEVKPREVARQPWGKPER